MFLSIRWRKAKKTAQLTLTFYSGGEEKGGKYSEKENIFFWRRRKTEKEKDENIWRRSLQKLSRILRSLGFGLSLETVANFWYRYRFWRIWSREKSIGFGFGEFGFGKKVSVLVSENLVSEKKSRYWFQSKFSFSFSDYVMVICNIFKKTLILVNRMIFCI